MNNREDYPVTKSPRKELQGPRPPALKLHKDSHKIKKPPIPPQQQQQNQQNYSQPRPPVIIYTVSPKVIHTHPNDFMALVQRLTGSSSTAASAATTTAQLGEDRVHNSGCISPAARYATIEKASRSSPREFYQSHKQQVGDMGFMDYDLMNQSIDQRPSSSSLFPTGILSPGPASLPPISPIFFSPASDHQNSISFFHDLSPVLHGNRSFLEGSFMPSPSTSFFVSPRFPSPSTPSIDLFNNFNNFSDI